MNAIAYPRLIKRVRAVLIDSVLVPVSVFGTLILGDSLGISHPVGKVMLLLVPIFVLEPGLVALTGGTVGHHLQGLRVTTVDGRRNVNLPKSVPPIPRGFRMVEHSVLDGCQVAQCIVR